MTEVRKEPRLKFDTAILGGLTDPSKTNKNKFVNRSCPKRRNTQKSVSSHSFTSHLTVHLFYRGVTVQSWDPRC